MRRRFTKRCLVFAALCGVLLLASCRKEDVSPDMPDDPQDPQAWVVGPRMMLHISTLNYGARSADTGVEERIKSLRIIMIHEDPDKRRYLEANRLIDIPDVGADGEGTLAGHFTYIFQKRTVVGKKSFYLIANEEWAAGVTVKDDDESVAGREVPSLTALLNSYEPAMPSGKKAAADGVLTTDPADDDPEHPDAAADAAAAAQAAEFEKLLQHLCLEPMQKLGSGKLYLPYSAYYHSGYDITEEGGYEVDMTDSPMYLVPVATKFTFKFINERTMDADGLEIVNLELRRTNKTNYLMANFDLSQYKNKEELYLDPVGGGGKQIHWIEWLRQVAMATNGYQTSDDITGQNSRFGWISCYQVPYPESNSEEADGGNDDGVVYDFIRNLPDRRLILSKAEQITGSSDKVTPYEEEIGPFYLPEGHHKEEKSTSDDTDEKTRVESYMLFIKMHPANEPSSGVKEAVTEISNLKYLFRNTSIRITIALHEGGVKIYAETAPWNPVSLWGYVQDEDDMKQK